MASAWPPPEMGRSDLYRVDSAPVGPVAPAPTPASTPVDGTGARVLNRNMLRNIKPSCPGCGESFLGDDIVPYLLDCGHSLCRKCSDSKAAENAGMVACPLDGRTSARTSLRPNYALDDIEKAQSRDFGGGTEAEMADVAQEMGVVCKVCMEEYDQHRLPFALPCGHTFCGTCVQSMNRRCPNRCDAAHDATPSTAHPKLNRGLMQMVNALRAASGLPLAEEREELPPAQSPGAGAAPGANGYPAQPALWGLDPENPGRAPPLPRQSTASMVESFLSGVFLAVMTMCTFGCAVVAITTLKKDCPGLTIWLWCMAVVCFIVPLMFVFSCCSPEETRRRNQTCVRIADFQRFILMVALAVGIYILFRYEDHSECGRHPEVNQNTTYTIKVVNGRVIRIRNEVEEDQANPWGFSMAMIVLCAVFLLVFTVHRLCFSQRRQPPPAADTAVDATT